MESGSWVLNPPLLWQFGIWECTAFSEVSTSFGAFLYCTERNLKYCPHGYTHKTPKRGKRFEEMNKFYEALHAVTIDQNSSIHSRKRQTRHNDSVHWMCDKSLSTSVLSVWLLWLNSHEGKISFKWDPPEHMALHLQAAAQCAVPHSCTNWVQRDLKWEQIRNQHFTFICMGRSDRAHRKFTWLLQARLEMVAQ